MSPLYRIIWLLVAATGAALAGVALWLTLLDISENGAADCTPGSPLAGEEVCP